jgi:hypothetical protein
MANRFGFVGLGLGLVMLLPGFEVKAADLPDKEIQERIDEAIGSLDKMTEMWQEERYEDLYDLGTKASRASITLERFSFFMRNRTRQPQCCFTRFQKPKGKLEAPDRVKVTVTIAYDYGRHAISRPPNAPMLPEHERDTFMLYYEGEQWRLDLNRWLELAWIPGRPY